MADITNLLAQGFDPLPSSVRANAMMQGEQIQQRRMQNALMQMQMQNALAQQQERQQQNALMSQFRDSIPSPQMQASQAALMGGGGPTVANAQRMPPVDQRLQMLHGAMKAGMVSPMDYIGAAMPAPEKPKDMVVGGNIVRVQGNQATPIFTAPKEGKPDEFIARMQAAGIDPASPEGRAMLRDKLRKESTHSPAVSVSYGAPMAGVDDKGNPVFFQPQKGGGAPAIVPGVRPSPKEEKSLTEGQAKALNFSSRMIAADRVLAQMSRKGVEFTIPGSTSNNVFGDVVNAISTPEQQQLTQAKRDFINATLRRESGAVISPDEFANAERQYFPVPGDSRVVREQKARNRRVAIEGIRADVPKDRQSEVERVSGAGSAPAANNDDPLGLRGGK
jgi:hypothetical protein